MSESEKEKVGEKKEESERRVKKLVIAPPDLHNSLKEQLKKMEGLLEELRRR